jgi:hypothetical protein
MVVDRHNLKATLTRLLDYAASGNQRERARLNGAVAAK